MLPDFNIAEKLTCNGIGYMCMMQLRKKRRNLSLWVLLDPRLRTHLWKNLLLPRLLLLIRLLQRRRREKQIANDSPADDAAGEEGAVEGTPVEDAPAEPEAALYLMSL